MVLSCHVTAASERDEWGAVWALDALQGRTPRLRLLRADAGYPGALASWTDRVLSGCKVEIVQRKTGQKGFVVLKGRWVAKANLRMARTQPQALERLRGHARIEPGSHPVGHEPSELKRLHPTDV